MKKLTWALLSLMLFLGMGTALVRAEVLPTLTFTPSGEQVSAAPGQTITFTVSEDLNFDDCLGYSVILCYGFDVDGQLKPSYEEITAWMYYFQSEGQSPKPQVLYEATMISDGMSTAMITIPEDASGLVEFSARLAAIDGDDMETPLYSDMMDASYVVQGEVAKPDAPTFDPAEGEVEAGTAVTIASDAQQIWYCINCEDADLTMAGYMEGKCQQYDADETEIKIFQGQTVKAVSVVGLQPPFSFSDVASATYTVIGGDVERTDIPKLTLAPAPAEDPVPVPGTATFSCTMDPQEYTQTPQGLVGFRIKAENAANIAKLEWRVDEDGDWTEFSEANMRNLGVAVPAIPDNTDTESGDKSRLLIANGARTVHYRITLNDATSASITFVCPEVNSYGMITATSDELATATLQFQSTVKPKPAMPTFTEEAGEVAFGTYVEIEAAEGTIYYTTDGSTPTEESEEYGWWSEILIAKAMTIKAIAVLDGVSSEVAEAAYTVAPVENAKLTLSPMKEDSVGKNVAVDVAFSDGTPASAAWINIAPAFVYYTVDGETVPSKAAYEAQADKENGAIKMVTVKWDDEYGFPDQDGAGNILPLTFGEATHLKAIGYLIDGEEVLLSTAVLDTMLQVKSEANPTLSLPNGMTVKAGDTLVIMNPNVWPALPEYDASDEEWEEYEAAIEGLPVTTMYYSFDGTLPTMANRFDDSKEIENVFSTSQEMGENITVVFKEDEEGELYAFVPAIYNRQNETSRPPKRNVQKKRVSRSFEKPSLNTL